MNGRRNCGIDTSFGNIPSFQMPYIPTSQDLEMQKALLETEAKLQEAKRSHLEKEKKRVKQMSNRELLESIYMKLLDMNL